MKSNHSTPQQEQAITSDHDRILLIAGAGSGKTRTLVDRIRYLIGSGLAIPEHIVAITFTNAAAKELQSRITVGPSGDSQQRVKALGHCGTIHSFALRLLRTHGGIIGIPTRVAIADEDTRTAIIERIIREHKFRGSKESLAEEIKKGPQTFDRHLSKLELAAQSYFTTMIDSGILDFDMILHYGRKLAETIAESFIARIPYEHLFVDEVQDLSDLEFRFLMALKIPFMFLVGDPDQSIYAFKGGNVRFILGLANRPDWQVIVLQENFRCGRVICELAQKLIEHNVGRFPKATISAAGYEGYVELGRNAPGELAELAKLSAMIHDIQQGRVRLPMAEEPEADPQIRPPSIAVLLRTNWLAKQAADYFSKSGIKVVRPETLQQPKDWRKACLLTALCANPHSDVAAFLYLGLKLDAKRADNIATAAAAEMVPIAAKMGLKLTEHTLGETFGMFALEGISLESQAKAAHIAQTLPEDSTLNDFALAMARSEEERDEPTDPRDGDGRPGITVCTIHKAKGREWDVVFLPAFEEQTIPKLNGSGSDLMDCLEEERRVAYVAVTRAKRWVVITYAKERIPKTFGFQQPVAGTVYPSRFLLEMGWQ